MFYLLLPVLAFLAWRLARGRTGSRRLSAVLAPAGLMLLAGLAGKLVTSHVPPIANLAIVACVTGVLSFVTYRLVELPALRRKRRVPTVADARAERPPGESGALPEAQLTT